MPLPKLIFRYLLTALVFFAIDIAWLGFIAKGLYRKYLGACLDLLKKKIFIESFRPALRGSIFLIQSSWRLKIKKVISYQTTSYYLRGLLKIQFPMLLAWQALSFPFACHALRMGGNRNEVIKRDQLNF